LQHRRGSRSRRGFRARWSSSAPIARGFVPEATLEELDIDSLDLFELGQILHQEFGIEVDPEDFEEVSTLGDAQEAMLSYVK